MTSRLTTFVYEADVEGIIYNFDNWEHYVSREEFRKIVPELPKRLEGFKFEVYGTGLPDRDHLEYKCMIRVEEEWGWMIADMDIQRLELVSTNTDD
jgi:hypothetical protein